MVQIEDDNDLWELQGKYLGKVLYDEEEGLFYRVLDINYTSHRKHDYWVACCVPVVCVNGAWVVEDKHLAGGCVASKREDSKPVYLHDPLEYITLGTILGPDNTKWTTSDIDAMIVAYESQKHPHSV